MFLEHFIKTSTNVNFRKAPVDGSVIKLLKTGTVLQVLSVDAPTGWYHAKLSDGTLGYITYKKGYVEDCEPAWLTKVRQIVLYGETYLGTPYNFGSSRSTDVTFDCSDYQRWIYKKYGYIIDSDSRSQSDDGTASNENDLRSGDLIFFAKNNRIHHVAMYLNIDYQDRLLHTYNETCNILDRNLSRDMRFPAHCGGVTFSDFSIGSYWRNESNFDTRRIVQGDSFVL